MPSTLLRLAVALLAFGLGVTATTLWIAYRTPEVKALESEPFRKKECNARPHMRLMNEPPLPFLDEPPPPPPLAPPRAVRATVWRGLLNERTLSKPAPIYPPGAIAHKRSGLVKVQVLVDEKGRVISAKAISGHPELHEAAVEAAYEAAFPPTVLGGEVVRVSGVISYNFVYPYNGNQPAR